MPSRQRVSAHQMSTCVVVLTITLLCSCDQSTQPTLASSASSDAIRFTPAYSARNNDPSLSGFAIDAVDAQGDVKPITTLKRDYKEIQRGPYVPLIFAYGSGKLARFIPASELHLDRGLPIGSPAQIEVVDLGTGEASRYQAPNDVNVYHAIFEMIPFSPDGTQLLIPNSESGKYYLLNLENAQITTIPDFSALSIIGWAADNQLFYAHTLKPDAQGGGDMVEQVGPQGHIVTLNLPSSDDSYNYMLSPDNKSLYYETLTSVQPLPSPDPHDNYSMVNLIERYDFASGSSTAVVHPAVGDYFPAGSRSFTLSPDGRSIVYIEYTPYSAQNPGAAWATIWSMDLDSASAPKKVVGGLYNPLRLTWCGDNLYYYDGGLNWRGWRGVPLRGGTPTLIEGEILGCAP